MVHDRRVATMAKAVNNVCHDWQSFTFVQGQGPGGVTSSIAVTSIHFVTAGTAKLLLTAAGGTTRHFQHSAQLTINAWLAICHGAERSAARADLSRDSCHAAEFKNDSSPQSAGCRHLSFFPGQRESPAIKRYVPEHATSYRLASRQQYDEMTRVLSVGMPAVVTPKDQK